MSYGAETPCRVVGQACVRYVGVVAAVNRTPERRSTTTTTVVRVVVRESETAGLAMVRPLTITARRPTRSDAAPINGRTMSV